MSVKAILAGRFLLFKRQIWDVEIVIQEEEIIIQELLYRQDVTITDPAAPAEAATN
jgi:hypothetical protein